MRTWKDANIQFWQRLKETHAKQPPAKRKFYAKSVQEAIQSLRTTPKTLRHLTYLNHLFEPPAARILDLVAIEVMKRAKAKSLPLIATVSNYNPEHATNATIGDYMSVFHYDHGTSLNGFETTFVNELVNQCFKKHDQSLRHGLNHLEFQHQQLHRH